MIVMSYLLKNGDAHLKNFGILYDSTMENRFLAPAYDVVNTVIYLAKDKPALSLFGKKIWLNKKKLLQFGEEYCFLDKKEAEIEFNICINAIKLIKEEIKTYVKITPSFKQFGNKFLNILEFSLNENLNKSYKEIPNGVL
jgi:serine/threonine-protein kinase HipA